MAIQIDIEKEVRHLTHTRAEPDQLRVVIVHEDYWTAEPIASWERDFKKWLQFVVPQ